MKNPLLIFAIVYSAVAGSALAQNPQRVGITRNGFEPKTIEIDRGTKVAFENKMRVKVIVQCDASNYTAEIDEGQTAGHVFQSAGEGACHILFAERKQPAGTIKVRCTPRGDGNKIPIEFELTSFRGEVNMVWGDSIEFKNASNAPIGVRNTEGGWDSGEIQPGASVLLKPTGIGAYTVQAYRGEKPGSTLTIRVFCQ